MEAQSKVTELVPVDAMEVEPNAGHLAEAVTPTEPEPEPEPAPAPAPAIDA